MLCKTTIISAGALVRTVDPAALADVDSLKDPEGTPTACRIETTLARLDRGEESWVGAAGYDRARVLRAIREGDAALWQRAQELVGKVATPAAPTDARRRLVRGPAGDEYDPHAVYRGALDQAWSARRRRTAHAPRPALVYADAGITSGTHADAMWARTAAALVLTDALETAGYTARLALGFATLKPYIKAPDRAALIVIAKDWGEPVHPARLAALALPGTIRGPGFAHLRDAARATGRGNRATSGLGRPLDTPPEVLADVADGARVLLVPRQVTTPEAARARVAELIREVDQWSADC